MNGNAGKLLVVESDDVLREHIVTVLNDAGYEVSTDYRDGMKAVLAFNPDAVVLGADPPHLSPGGSAERTRGLDLGADDVLSLPFYPHELLSRVRSQLVIPLIWFLVTAMTSLGKE